MEQLRRRLEEHTDALPTVEGKAFWAFPAAQYTYFHRLLALVSRQMRLQEECEISADH